MIVTIVLIALSAIFKAVSDTLSHHYSESIFKKFNEQWWNPTVSSSHVGLIKYTKYRPDAWHLSNSAMIACLLAAIVWNPVSGLWWLWFLGYAALFIVVFNLFYNKVLR